MNSDRTVMASWICISNRNSMENDDINGCAIILLKLISSKNCLGKDELLKFANIFKITIRNMSKQAI